MFMYHEPFKLPKLKPIKLPKPDPMTDNFGEYNTADNAIVVGRCAKSGVRFKVLIDGSEIDPDVEFPEVSVYSCGRSGVFGYVFRDAFGSRWRWLIMRNLRTAITGESMRMSMAVNDMAYNGDLHFGTGGFTHSSDVTVKGLPSPLRESIVKARYQFEVTG